MSIIQKFPLRYTPFLYTFPGSGGSWLQSVIEHATGVNTGSIGCPGERSTRRNGFCSRRVSLVKLHANLWSHIKLSQGNFSDECVAEGVYSFNRAVLLIRDPFEVIWAATRHIVNSLVKSNNNGSYNTVIPSVQLSAWWSEARGTAERFARMVDTQYAWVRRVLAERDVLVVRYEDLSDGNVNNRKELITQVINFLQLPNSAINPPNTSRSEQVSLDQLACSLLLADYSDVSFIFPIVPEYHQLYISQSNSCSPRPGILSMKMNWSTNCTHVRWCAEYGLYSAKRCLQNRTLTIDIEGLTALAYSSIADTNWTSVPAGGSNTVLITHELLHLNEDK